MDFPTQGGRDANERPAWRALPWRYALYVAAVALLAEALVVAAESGWLHAVGPETGPVEYAHQILCASAAVLLARAAILRPDLDDVLVIAAYAAVLGLIRETDALLDHVAFKGAYKVPAFFVGVLALRRLWRARRRLMHQVREAAREPGFHLIVVGALVVLVYAQIVGQKELWKAIMGPAYARPVKDAAEELQELLGYALIAIGSVEAYVTARRRATDASGGRTPA